MRKLVVAGLLLASTFSAKADFIGGLKLGPPGCMQTEECTLLENFGYEDPYDRGWQAQKNNKTDGASIPQWAQKFVGIPFDKRYIKAAVLHDHYVERRVRTWHQTHRMFYTALRESGVGRIRARVLYTAVLIGGPKWITQITPRPCDSTVNACIFSVGEFKELTKEKSYQSPEFKKDFKKLLESIEAKPDISLEEIEDLLLQRRPNDVFLRNPFGTVVIQPPLSFYRGRN